MRLLRVLLSAALVAVLVATAVGLVDGPAVAGESRRPVLDRVTSRAAHQSVVFKGRAKPLGTVKGTLWFGFILTLVYYIWFIIMQ